MPNVPTLTSEDPVLLVQLSDSHLFADADGSLLGLNTAQSLQQVIDLVREFDSTGMPIAAICHGAWLLVNAGLVAGKTAAPCRYIAADIENAGGHYVDEQLHVDDANGFKLITSRKPDDLDYFVGAIKDALK